MNEAYGLESARVGRTLVHSHLVKLVVLAVFVAAAIVGAGVARLLK